MPKIVKSGIVYSSGSTMPAANIPYTPPSGSGSTATTAKAAIDEALTGVKDLKSSLSTTNGNVTSVTNKADTNASNITKLTTRMGTAETNIKNATDTANSLNATSSLAVTAVADSYTSAKSISAWKNGHVIVVRGTLTISKEIPKGSSFNICTLPTATATAPTVKSSNTKIATATAAFSGNTADAFARTTTSLLTSIESADSVNITPTTVTCMLPCAITLSTATLAFSNANDAIPAGSTITFSMVYIAK